MDEQPGDALRRLRLERDLSVRDVARVLHRHYSYVSHVESGRKPMSPELASQFDREFHTGGTLTDLVTRHEPLPAQLPPVDELVGRDHLIAEIATWFAQRPAETATSPRTIVLTGTGGSGKTALAVTVAHQIGHRFDGILWADLRAWDENTGPRDPMAVLRAWCVALGARTTELPSHIEELIALWRSVAAHRKYVIGIDNVRQDQIPPLIPASPGSVVLVTSRDRVPEIPGSASRVTVPPLDSESAATLLAARAGVPRERVTRLAARAGGLPLAVRAIGDYVAAHNADEEMIYEMSHDTSPPDAIRRAASLSYRHLTPEQARAWRLCAMLPDVTPEAAAAITGLERQTVRTLLNAVADATLLSKHGRGWQYHELHRAYALEASQASDSREIRDEAAYRALTYLLHGWNQASITLAPHRDIGPALDAPPPGIPVIGFESYDAALAWAESRWEYMPIAVRAALDQGWTTLAWHLVAVTFNYVLLVQPWTAMFALARPVAEAAERDHDNEGLAWMCYIQGAVRTGTGEIEHAIPFLVRALELRRELGYPRDVGWSAQLLARAHLLHGDPPDTPLTLLTESIAALDTINAYVGAASARSLRGTTHLAMGEFDLADTDLSHALDMPPGGEPEPMLDCYARSRLADVRLVQHRPAEAITLAAHAAHYAHEHTAEYSEVDALNVLGTAYRDHGDTDNARTTWTRALHLADKIDSPLADEIQDRLNDLP